MKESRYIDLTHEQLHEWLGHLKQEIPSDDYSILESIVLGYCNFQELLQEKRISIARLRALFGIKTESFKNFNQNPSSPNQDQDSSSTENDISTPSNSTDDKSKKDPPNGHGQRSSDEYSSAKVIQIAHETLKKGQLCPDCGKGRLYSLKPGRLVRVVGQPWIQVEVYKPEKLRCSACGKVFTAKVPQDVATQPRAHTTAKAIVCLLKYRGGFPFYRQGQLQELLGAPISNTEIWEWTRDVAEISEPIFLELVEEAAQGCCLHNDDTKARVMELIKENGERKAKGEKARVGIYTTAILAKVEQEHEIALFFTGRQHAGENLNDVLDYRSADLGPPIQMCDAASRSETKDHKTQLANCLAHARRKFFELVLFWPVLLFPIIHKFNQVFDNEAKAKNWGLVGDERLDWHKAKSQPLMDEILSWCNEMFEKKRVEPNSSLGKAITYFKNHWDKLTLFTRVSGTPLDNNVNERLIKRAVLNRKNAYFFKTANGAKYGDILLSLIETCALNGINPFDYLVEIQSHSSNVKAHPENWLPWNYREQLAEQ